MPLPILALLLVQVNFGLLPVAQKYILGVLSPWELLLVRVSGAAAIFCLLYACMKVLFRKDMTAAYPMTASVRIKMLAFALIGVSLNQLFLILGLTRTGALSAAIIVPAITIFTYVFALMLGKEAFNIKKASTLALGSLGVLVLLGDSIRDFTMNASYEHFIGIMFCILSAASYAFYLVVSKPYAVAIHPIRFSFHLFFYGFLWVISGLAFAQLFSSLIATGPGFILTHLPTIALGKSLETSYIITLLSIVFGPTIIAYLLNIWALRFLDASTVSGFICLQTLIGIFGAKLWLAENITPVHIVASLCIISSILLLTKNEKAFKMHKSYR